MFTNPFSTEVNARELELVSQVAALKVEVELLRKDNDLLRSRIASYESDDRELRHSLLTRVGVLVSPTKARDGETTLKPVRTSPVPWATQAARLEADSKERYWKKLIEDREALEARVQAQGQPQPSEVKSESEQIQEDIEELSR